jgi:NADH-quinone oxidoreductase subunit N
MLIAILIFLTVSGIITFIAASSQRAENETSGGIFGGITLAVFAITAVLAVLSWTDTSTPYGVLRAGPLAAVGSIIMAGIGLLVTAGVMANPEKYKTGVGEFFGLVIFTVLGGIVMLSSSNLIVLYLGIELSSYSTYILVGYYRDDRFSNEAAAKYFLLGAVASAFLLFGMSLIYGGSGSISPAGTVPGSLDYAALAQALGAQAAASTINPLIWPGLAFLLVGFGFKLALAPFHSWTPDAYQGAPTMVAALLSVGPKAATVIALVSLLQTAFAAPQILIAWQTALTWLAMISMTVGNLGALQQKNVKRMLGYSSIAQLGYVIMGVVASSSAGTASLILYMAGYALTNIGAFTVVASLRDAGVGEEVDDYAGLIKRSPVAAILLVGFFMSLAGVPLFAGFLGKLLVFKSAVDAGLIALTVVAVLNTVIAYYYYFRVIIQATLMEPKTTASSGSGSFELNPNATLALAVALAGVIFLGVFPTGAYNAFEEAARTLQPIVQAIAP